MAIGSAVQGIMGKQAANKQYDAIFTGLESLRRYNNLSNDVISRGHNRATKRIKSGARRANRDLKRGGRQARGALRPFRTGLGDDRRALRRFVKRGDQAGDALSYELGLSNRRPRGYSFEGTPGQEFLREEGERAILRTAAARGGLDSGSTLREIADYTHGLASTDYDNHLRRLTGVSEQGRGAANFNLAQGFSASGALAQILNRNATAGANIDMTTGGTLGALETQTANNTASGFRDLGTKHLTAYGAAGDAKAGGALAIGNAVSSGLDNTLGLAALAMGSGLIPMGGGAAGAGSAGKGLGL